MKFSKLLLSLLSLVVTCVVMPVSAQTVIKK
jgi:hypothetical protein